MKQLSLLLLLLSLCTAVRAQHTVGGRIYCAEDNRPLSGVAVSDGDRVVVSDADGRYELTGALRDGYIFITLPSGYRAPADGVIPRFFLRAETSRSDADFPLHRLPEGTAWRVIVANDLHLENRPGKNDVEQFRAGFAADMLRLDPIPGTETCIVALGDMTTDKWWYKTQYGLPEYLREMERIGLPVFHVMGNHDNDIRGGSNDWERAGTYRRVIGPTSYSFDMAGTHWVVLDNTIYDGPNDASGETDYRNSREGFDAPQLRWLERDLALVADTTQIVICAHSPFYRYGGPDKLKEGCGGEVLKMLGRFGRVLLLTGHTHLNYNVEISKHILEHNNISASGSAWNTTEVCSQNITRDGTPAGYLQCDIAGGSLRWHYVPSGGDWRTGQFRSYDLNLIAPEHGGEPGSNAVLLNVFNWDPAWEITVREKGRKLPVVQVWAVDPFYAQMSAGSSLMRAPSLRPVRSPHLFRVQASKAGTPLEIEVRDRFGNLFRERMERPKESK